MSPYSTFGNYLKLTVRGASHAKKMTFALANFPAGLAIDAAALAALMARRAPGRDPLSTSRRETDEVVFTAGVADGVTTGRTVCGEIASHDMRPRDYGVERTIPRPGHADFGQWVQYGRIPTGGGKNSGRLTAPLCAAGALCLQYLARRGIRIQASIAALGGMCGGTAEDYEKVILSARHSGDSVGGQIVCRIAGLPPGLGGPLFEGLDGEISAALFGIPGVKGVFFGLDADRMCALRGSEYNDSFCVRDGLVGTCSARQGGILGGRTVGTPVSLTVVLRPTPTVFKPQPSVDLATMQPADCVVKGRHDPCIVRRAVPVVEAVTAFALADRLLAEEAAHPRICLTLTGRTLAEDVAQYMAQRYFTDMVELRVDLLEDAERARVAAFPAMLAAAGSAAWQVPIILTYRRKSDGGAFAGEESERRNFFAQIFSPAIRPSVNPPFSYVDFEEDFSDAALVAAARAAGAKVIRSLHDFTGPVADLPARLRDLAASGDVAKIAFMPHAKTDIEALFAQLHPRASSTLQAPNSPAARLPPYVVCAMGPLGLSTRVLAARLGSCWTYASVGGLGAIGHLTPYELVRDYRFRSITSAARVAYVPAAEVARTNADFLAEDEDAVALPEIAEPTP
ncbi:MAG: chorismate synthase [Kiritimatiellia bacterium]